ncbi:hypothetical protein HanXRQr2_Chr03g0103111 [Helianthus annuus]|uniref:Uncharacterized protein n=1 Tax=Helianthus annuus TaxID=4232 RepID=A0A251V696_HELAN|nr:hypothetical protein HanXRQr2_Chr03g0103111 [Helianthus annuus]KAJ0600084.1 hypothetical protein HanIR_Chr03g0112531 [Helianthus annuus]KAJ0943068.1 hypothetical protein HanPSC8_Chr03g0099601 [Helianthus annuus]
MQQTLRNSEIGLTYLKQPLYNLEISFGWFGVSKSSLFDSRDYLCQIAKVCRFV